MSSLFVRFDRLACELLGQEAGLSPVSDHYANDPYRTRADYRLLCILVCDLLPGVAREDWWGPEGAGFEAMLPERVAMLEAVLPRARAAGRVPATTLGLAGGWTPTPEEPHPAAAASESGVEQREHAGTAAGLANDNTSAVAEVRDVVASTLRELLTPSVRRRLTSPDAQPKKGKLGAPMLRPKSVAFILGVRRRRKTPPSWRQLYELAREKYPEEFEAKTKEGQADELASLIRSVRNRENPARKK